MHILSIVGARPQFVKASIVSRVLRERGMVETLVHTGQHYDHGMSAVFFEELGIPEPDHNLGVGSGTHARQTGEMLVGIERLLIDNRPDTVVVYGDTNSTLAGALAAAKLHVPVAHVEAGLRSFNRRMPEEINRVMTDHLSDLLFCPTGTAVENLSAEGLTSGVVTTGDVMLEATRHFAERASDRVPLSSVVDYDTGAYAVATIHRAENVDVPERLEGILQGLRDLDLPVILPLHPRTRKMLGDRVLPSHVVVVDPLSYLAMLTLVSNARCVLTDSGGLQKEALWLGTPCITLRDETEWVETLEGGWNRLAGADPQAILEAYRARPTGPIPEFGSAPGGPASVLIARSLEDQRT